MTSEATDRMAETLGAKFVTSAPTKPPEAVKVTQGDVTDFLNFGFRHIRLPMLDAGDIDDIRDSLVQFATRHREEAEKRIVDWLLDPHRCPFGNSPLHYADMISRGEHIQENSDGE